MPSLEHQIRMINESTIGKKQGKIFPSNDAADKHLDDNGYIWDEKTKSYSHPKSKSKAIVKELPPESGKGHAIYYESIQEEAKTKIRPMYVSCNYSKNNGTSDGEHAVAHYQVEHPADHGISDQYHGQHAVKQVQGNADHKALLNKGFKVVHAHVSQDQNLVKKDADFLHDHNNNLTNMMKQQKNTVKEETEQDKDDTKKDKKFTPYMKHNRLAQIKNAVIDEGIKEKIQGIVRREKQKDVPILQTRSDYAWGKAADSYAKNDKKNGDRYWKQYKKLGGEHIRIKEEVETKDKKRLDTVTKVKKDIILNPKLKKETQDTVDS